MNTILLKICALFFILYSTTSKSQIKILEINASALVDDKNVGEYSILIYADGQLKDSIYCKKTKAMTLSLESQKLYSIVFKKPSFSNKLVIVDTSIPSGLRELVEEPFELQIELAKNAADLKKDLSDYPVAIITVSRREKSLMASENYYKLTHK